MTKCIDVNCWYHKEYGNDKNCPISKEVHDIGQSQKRKAELKRLENCFRIIRHELELMKKIDKPYWVKQNLSMLKQIREYMI